MSHSQRQYLRLQVQSRLPVWMAMESDRRTFLNDERKTPFSSRETISAWQLKRYLYSKHCKIASCSFPGWSVTIKLFCLVERQFYSHFKNMLIYVISYSVPLASFFPFRRIAATPLNYFSYNKQDESIKTLSKLWYTFLHFIITFQHISEKVLLIISTYNL